MTLILFLIRLSTTGKVYSLKSVFKHWNHNLKTNENNKASLNQNSIITFTYPLLFIMRNFDSVWLLTYKENKSIKSASEIKNIKKNYLLKIWSFFL